MINKCNVLLARSKKDVWMGLFWLNEQFFNFLLLRKSIKTKRKTQWLEKKIIISFKYKIKRLQ